MRDRRLHTQAMQGIALCMASAQIPPKLSAGDREQPRPHLLVTVRAHARPAEPFLSKSLGRQFQRYLAVQGPPRQKHQHRLSLLLVEGEEPLGLSHHSEIASGPNFVTRQTHAPLRPAAPEMSLPCSFLGSQPP